MSDMARWPVVFYNLRVGRPMAEVRAEVSALLETGAMIVAGCEGVGYVLPQHPDYRQLRNRATASSANVWAYVHKSIPVSRVRWIRMNRTWRRVKHPHLGQHPSRTILKFRAAGVRFAVAHHPQVDPPNTVPARAEHVDRLARILSPWRRFRWWGRLPGRIREREVIRPAVALWDPNAAQETLANMTGGQIVGGNGEGAVIRGGRTYGVAVFYPKHAGGVPLKSDHKRALRFLLVFPARWAA